MKQALSLGATSLLALSLLTGCSASSDDPPASGSTSTEATAATGSDAPVAVDPAPAVSVDTGTVIATQEYTIPGTEDKVTFGVQSLVVQGKTMTLQLVLTPDFASVSDSAAVAVYDMTGSSAFVPKLIDRENLKEYSVISDTGQRWSTDRALTKTTNHEPVIWWGVYAAPEDNNESFELRLLDSMAEFTDVPVTQ